jgi:hypothetical protein
VSNNYNNHNVGEKRKHGRYAAETKVYFSVIYDVQTKVKFQVLDKDGRYEVLGEKFPAISKDISAEGMRISCKRELKKGDSLHLEIYIPHQKEPLSMEGEVRWSQKLQERDRFDAGIKLLTINGKPVSSSVYHDGVNQIVWSAVLESIFGDFKKIAQKRYAI